MSNLLSRITTRLDRLRDAPDGKRAPPGKAAPAPAPPAATAPPAAGPVTIQSLTDALGRLAEERRRQVAIIENADAERDRIMDAEDGDDAELLAIDNRVALARLAIERLTRLENEAVEQLAPLQLAERQRRWNAAVARYVLEMRNVHAAMEAYERAANVAWATRAALFAQAPYGWDDVVPKLPQFTKITAAGFTLWDSTQYAAEGKRFATTRLGERPTGSTYSQKLESYLHGRIELEDLVPPVGTWGSHQQTEPSDHPVLIRLSRAIKLPDGEVLPMGVLVKVRAADARVLILANRATLNDALANVPGSLVEGGNLPLRELPLPGAGSAA